MITIRCIVDNTAQRGSALWGEHGVAFAIETDSGRVLFDTGQSGEVLAHNAAEMEIDLRQFDALAISHAHFDHTGGLKRALGFLRPDIHLYANPSLFQERFEVNEGEQHNIGLKLWRSDLAQNVNLRLSAEPAQILPGVWTTGEIADRSSFEGRSAQHFVQEDGRWQPDPYRDDLSLVLEARDGLVVVCGCCHAGLLNTLARVRQMFERPIQAVIGGTHLVGADSTTMAHAVKVLREAYNGETMKLYPNHCTGERAYLALVQAFGERVQPCPAGTVLNFD